MTAETLVIDAPFPFAGARTGKEPGSRMNEAKFEAFYRKTAASLWSYLYRVTGDAAAADDLLQKTFFSFLRANPALASDEHMRHYIFRTATNMALDHFRDTKRRRLITLVQLVSAPATDSSELRHDMMRLFSQLKPRERALLWLAHVEESDHEEIGQALGIQPRSVRVLLFRARKKLADLLTRNGLAPEGPRD